MNVVCKGQQILQASIQQKQDQSQSNVSNPKKMNPISKISYLLSQRLQFLQSLFLISSFQQLMTSNTSSLIQKHSKMQKQQIDTVTNVLRAVRIDDYFKKQFHTIVLRIFNKVQSGTIIRQQPTGTYKDIISDYLVFFGELKQKYIVDFIKQIFQLHIYNQTTVVYVLVELLFKFLRIKCMSFITDRIQPKASARQALDRFSYLMLNQGEKMGNKRVKNVTRQKINASSLSHDKRKASFESKSQHNQQFHIKSKTIVYETNPKRQLSPNPTRKLFSASSQKRHTIHQSLDPSTCKPKRRIIKSYKDIQSQTKQKIQSINMNMNRQYSYSKSRPYANMFMQVYKEEWDVYRGLIGNWEKEEDEEEGEGEGEAVGRYEGASERRKVEWYGKNRDKVVVEACTRNDDIRKQMQAYSQQYYNKFKK